VTKEERDAARARELLCPPTQLDMIGMIVKLARYPGEPDDEFKKRLRVFLSRKGERYLPFVLRGP
jgi:hypothetical protein